MKMIPNSKNLKILIPAAGLLGALLRCVFYLTGTDEKGLLVTGHWAHIALWILTGAAGLLLVAGCFRLQGPSDYKDCYPASFPAAAGCFVAALAFLLTGLKDWRSSLNLLESAASALCFLSAAALVYVAFCRLAQFRSRCYGHAAVCVCLALRMVCQYRLWSSDPQLLDYCFYMAAHVGLMITAYQLAAFDAGMGNHRSLWFSALAAVYFCLLCLWSCPNPLLMICCGIWVLSNLTQLNPRPRRVRPQLQLDEEA